MRFPFSPACSIRRAANVPGGFVNMLPEFGMLSGCVAFRRAMSSLFFCLISSVFPFESLNRALRTTSEPNADLLYENPACSLLTI
ncbi:hypothetical protein D3C83_118180 [compost metagenome]